MPLVSVGASHRAFGLVSKRKVSHVFHRIPPERSPTHGGGAHPPDRARAGHHLVRERHWLGPLAWHERTIQRNDRGPECVRSRHVIRLHHPCRDATTAWRRERGGGRARSTGGCGGR